MAVPGTRCHFPALYIERIVRTIPGKVVEVFRHVPLIVRCLSLAQAAACA